MSSCIKRFVNRHLNVVNFFTASIIICICLIVLLPAVHLDLTSHLHEDEHDENAEQQQQQQQQQNHHHHHHSIPTGEVLICAGFFVFHSIGLLVGGKKIEEREPLLIAERKISNVCCSSTRCPSSRGIADVHLSSEAANSHEQMLEGAHSVYSIGQEDNCVLLLNQHHQHHTHNTHHRHATTSNYGSLTPDLVRGARPRDDKHSRIYVEEIKASPIPDEVLRWPSSVKVGLFAIIFALSLVLFDFKLYGLMDALQVFRATSVGALLYMAFFLVLPKDSAGCGQCPKKK